MWWLANAMLWQPGEQIENNRQTDQQTTIPVAAHAPCGNNALQTACSCACHNYCTTVHVLPEAPVPCTVELQLSGHLCSRAMPDNRIG